ncbi:MAG: PEP-CTERM sorting domain-containing protein [Planctomycetota bacterium]
MFEKLETRMNLRFNLLATVGAAASIVWAAPSHATIMYSTPDAVVSEDFDGAAQSAATLSWVDDSSVPNWFAYQTATDAAPSDYRVTSGESTAAELYLWRENASATDFAFGTKPNTSSGDMMFGFAVTNDTGQTLTEFSLGYTGEQWAASGSGNNNQLVVGYQLGSIANLGVSGWTTIDDLTFNSPQDVIDDGTLDGNDAANREVFGLQTITGLDWLDGQELWIRWFDANSSGVDQGLGVDDVVFSAAVPEPASLMLVALGGAAILLPRRRA